MNQSAGVAKYQRIHWRNSSFIVRIGELLVLILAVLHHVSARSGTSNTDPVMYAVMVYCAVLICGEVVEMFGRMIVPVIVARTWLMAIVVVWIMWSTDGLSSPLRNGILLAILVSALAVGKTNSILLIALLIVNTLALVHHSADASMGFAAILGETVTRITPQAIVGYLVTVFGTDLRYRLSAWRLDKCRCPSSGLLDPDGLAIELARLHGEMLHSAAPLCALVLTVKAAAGEPSREVRRIQKAVELLAANVFLELRCGDIAARHGTDSILILMAHAVLQDCMDLEQKLRDVVDLDSIRMEAGLTGLEVFYTRVFCEHAPQRIDLMLSGLDAGIARPAF